MRGITLGVLQQRPPLKLVEYNFNDSTFNPSIVHAGVTASPITGNNLDLLTILEGFYTSPVLRTIAVSQSVEESYLIGRYFSLTLSGISRTTKIEFQAARGGSSTNRGFGLKTSYNSFQSPLIEAENVETIRPIWSPYSVNANLSNLGNIELRFYIATTSSGSGNNSIEFDNIIIYGN